MTTDAATQPAAPIAPASTFRRIYGYGSPFGKTVRDSRRAMLLVGAVLGLLLIGVAKGISAEFATQQSRLELGNVIRSVPPILQGLAGRPVNVETLGGYIQYKYGTFFPLIASLWSILALSGTLAAEARRGSLEFVAAAPISRRKLALEKLIGHVVVVTIASALIFVSLAIVGSSPGGLPGDQFPVIAAAGYAIWLALLALAAGSVAFALAPFVGRGAAAGIAGAVTFGGFIVSGYAAAIPALAPFGNLTWFGWTANHLPLAGAFDWAPLLLVAAVAVVMFAIGVEAFARRDLGATSAIPTPSLPRALVGLRGPASRSVGHNLPTAIGWGIGLGIFGLLIAGSAGPFVKQLSASADFSRLLGSLFPGIDFATVGGFLQLLFLEFGFILGGLAAATLVAGWASDETSGRLELLLATPLARARWAAASGLGVLVDIGVVVAGAMVGIGIGAAITGGDIVTPVVGTLTIGLFAVAMAGVGFAVGGVFRTGLAAPVVALVAVLTWFIDIIVPALGLPAGVHDLALTAHYGLPMLGRWDLTGVVASLAIGLGGLAIGAWGFARRDLRG
ncbi:MAG: ABC transporter permease subunit [Chloroflexota bacterium]